VILQDLTPQASQSEFGTARAEQGFLNKFFQEKEFLKDL